MQTREAVLSGIDEILKGKLPEEVRRKPGRLIVRTTLPDTAGRQCPVFLKVYTPDGWWNRVISTIGARLGRKSRAQIERANLEWAASQGIPVPRLISECGSSPLDVVVTEELTGMSAVHMLIPKAAKTAGGEAFQAWKRELVEELARLTRLLHRSNRYHKDLYLCHFFLPDNAVTDRLPIRGRLHLLDYLRLKHHRWNRRRWQVKDLAELLYSSDVPGVDARDLVRFMHAYLDCRKLDSDARRLVKSVVSKAARYRRQNRGR